MMNHIKQSLDQIGFSFADVDQEQIDNRNKAIRQIAEIKKRQHQIHTLVKLGMVKDKDQAREAYKKLNREIIKLEREL